MSSGLESEEVFAARAAQMGVPNSIIQQLKAANISTMGSYAFCCSYQPGSHDESPLVDIITQVTGGPPSIGLMSQLRRLFFESHTVAIVDMRSRTDRTDEDTPRKIQLPERVSRMVNLRARYPGLLIGCELEFSYALLDRVIDQYDKNELRYIDLRDCTRRDQELDGVKRDDRMKIDIKIGEPLKVGNDPAQPTARLATDLEIRNAFIRRALAYDAGGLITFTLMELWVVKLFRLMQQPQIEDHAPISLQQIYRADKRLWALMAEENRANIIPAPGAAKPLDSSLTRLADHVEVTFLLLPLPLARGSANIAKVPVDTPVWVAKPADGPYVKPEGKGKGKGKGKPGKSQGKKGEIKSTAVKVSPYGCAYKISNGKPCCIFYNSATGCKDESVHAGKRCARGFHCCGKVLSSGIVCSGDHPMQACNST